MVDLLEAIPFGVTRLVFRRVGPEWGVAIPGGEPFWISVDYPGRGKDLYNELCLALEASRPDVELARELVTEEDWAWYAHD